MSLSDSKFISESKLLPELIQDTDFLNNSEISKNAEKIINACRQNKKERTKLDAFLSEYGLDNQELGHRQKLAQRRYGLVYLNN